MNGAQHILVVDDEPDLRKLVSDFLTRNGYHVFEAHDGVAMMETMKSSRIDTTAGRDIDVHVSRLRRRIEADPEQPDFIKTVRGEGYLFAAPVTLNGRSG